MRPKTPSGFRAVVDLRRESRLGFLVLAIFAAVAFQQVHAASIDDMKMGMDFELRKLEDEIGALGKQINDTIKIPENWTVKPSQSGGGVRYLDPNDANNNIRLSPGNPNSEFPNSQVPYMRIHQSGKGYVDINGNPVKYEASEGHIPIKKISD